MTLSDLTITTAQFPKTIDLLFINCHLATMTGGSYGIIKNPALGVTGKKISMSVPSCRHGCDIRKNPVYNPKEPPWQSNLPQQNIKAMGEEQWY